jgi:16S rRNA (guanine966-N2)-methyltransferase
VKQEKSGSRRASARANDAGSDARKARGASRVLRIVGGRHRGRRLHFPAGVEIRPTPDRVRETLFNWLQPRIGGAHVLDLFAGSGALGIEALSRGAAQATFVERDRRAASAIDTVLKEWQEPAATVVVADALAWLSGPPSGTPYDIVFRDPLPALPASWREQRAGRAGEVGYHLYAS